jgi:hypothetical protein
MREKEHHYQNWSELLLAVISDREQIREGGHLVFEAERPPIPYHTGQGFGQGCETRNPTSFSLATAITKAVQPWALCPKEIVCPKYHRFIQ